MLTWSHLLWFILIAQETFCFLKLDFWQCWPFSWVSDTRPWWSCTWTWGDLGQRDSTWSRRWPRPRGVGHSRASRRRWRRLFPHQQREGLSSEEQIETPSAFWPSPSSETLKSLDKLFHMSLETNLLSKHYECMGVCFFLKSLTMQLPLRLSSGKISEWKGFQCQHSTLKKVRTFLDM